MAVNGKDGTNTDVPPPICVDLDGSLLRIDSLHEAAFHAVVQNPITLFQFPAWLARGKARLKEELAKRWSFDPAHLPYNESCLAFLQSKRADGHRIVLVTAADRAIAQSIADHHGIFDEVIASDGTNNLRGTRKAEVLCKRFGEGGFIYAGNDATDLHVWNKSAGAVLVNAPVAVKQEALTRYAEVTTIDEQLPSTSRALAKAMRPYQWVKNVLVFFPMLAAGNIQDLSAWLSCLVIFAAFCCVASGIYLLNDMADLASDRVHPRNRRRPFASGTLSMRAGLLSAPILIVGGFWLGAQTNAFFTIVIYFALSMAYNVKLKEMPLIDVFLLAALYSIRLFGGGEASGNTVSVWLLGFSSFIFLSLAMVKRTSELNRLRNSGHNAAARRGYMATDLEIVQMMGCAAAFASAVVLSLYIQSHSAELVYENPEILWALIPLILFWQCRLWLSAARGYMHDDPIVYAARDWVSWLVFLAGATAVLAAHLPFTFSS